MALNVSGDNSLEWNATINTDDFINGQKKIEASLQESARKAVANNKEQERSIKDLSNTIETLRGKILVKQDLLIKESDLEKISKYNKEIEILQARIDKISNAGKTGFTNIGDKIKPDLGILQKLQQTEQELTGKIASSKSVSEISSLNVELAKTKDEITKLSNVGKVGFDALGNSIEPQIGIIGKLEKQLASLKTSLTQTSSPAEIVTINKKIEETEKALNKLSVAGKNGFNDIGRPLVAQQGILEKLQRQAGIYQKAILSATVPENIAKYNAKLEATNGEIKKLSNAGKAGFDALGNAVGGLGKITDGVAAKTNALSKGYGLLKTAANILPGLGISGIFLLIFEGVSALIKAFNDGGKALDDFKTKYNTLSKALDSGGYQDAIKNVESLKIEVDLAKKGFIDKKDVVEQYNSTIGQTTGLVKTLDEVERKLTESGEAYIKMTLLKAAANISLEEAAKKAVEAEKIRLKKLDDFKNQAVDNNISIGGAGGVGTGAFNAKEFDRDTQRVKDAQQKRKDALIKIETDAGKQQTDIAKGFLKQAAEISAKNNFDFQGNASTHLKDAQKAAKDNLEAQRKLNEALKQRQELLNAIAGLNRGSEQSGLLKEASEVDKINEKYDVAIQKIKEFNNAHSDPRLIIGADVIGNLNNSRAIEISNANSKAEAAAYIAALDDKKKAFDDFQKIQLEGNEEVTAHSKELYKDQIGDFTSYVDFLKNEQGRLLDIMGSGTATIGTFQEFEAVNKKIVAQQNTDAEAKLQKQLSDYKRLLQETETFNDRKKAIEVKYEKDVEILKKQFTGEDLNTRLRTLSDTRARDLIDLQDNLAAQGQLYQVLNQNIIRSTRDQLKDRLALLKKYLADGFIIERDGTRTTLTPAMKSDLKAGIKQATDFLNSTNEIFGVSVDQLNKIAKYTAAVSSAFANLGNSVRPFNEGLAEVFDAMSNIADVSTNLVSSFASFASGDITASIGSAVGAVGGIINLIGSIDAKYKKELKQYEDFNDNVFKGEFAINELYRQRTLEQLKINKLRIDGLKAEAAALTANKQKAVDDYSKIFEEIGKLNFVASVTRENGFFGVTTKEIRESLGGKSFDDLEKLFLTGKLEGKAKELFEMLQKLKQEGIDIDAALEENKQKAKETFTGTTADNITDMIVQGFGNGKRAVADFADDTESLIRGALLNALKYKALEGPLQKLYDQFAADAESGGGLDLSEVTKFQNGIADAIKNANTMAQELEKATGVSLTSGAAGGSGNSLTGAIKGMSAQQADLLAGQFGGLRLTALDQLRVVTSSLSVLNKIEANTAASATTLANYYRKWDTQGLKVI